VTEIDAPVAQAMDALDRAAGCVREFILWTYREEKQYRKWLLRRRRRARKMRRGWA
jgi:hypothetical protein